MYNKKKDDEVRMRDYLNYTLAKYIMVGVNEPKKFPSKPFLHKQEFKEMTAEEMERMVERLNLKLGGSVQDG